MTPAQAGFWRKLRQHDRSIPETFTPGDYRCPAHDDQRASLSVDYKGNRVLWHCQAACAPEAVRRRLGIAWVDVDDYGGAIGKQHTATYTYTDAAGVPELRVLRYDPKDFRVQRREDGEWVWGRGKAPYRLYQLPRVAEAVQAGERVWLVEGEKDADAMTEQAGAAATTTPGGAGKTWRPEYTEALRGAYLTIVADRDEAGRKHARTAYAALVEVAAEVVLVEPNLNRPHADAFDHLAAGFGLDDFAPLAPGSDGDASLSPVESAATVPPVPADPPTLAADQRILGRFEVAVGRLGVVGERTTAATAYLVLCSRLLDKQASLAVKGHSASGKSFTIEQTVRFFPPEAVITMTAMSQRALVYSTEQYAHRTLVVYEAVALREGVQDDLTSYFIRSLLSEGRIEYPVTVRDEAGGFTTKTIVKEGPTNLIVTTTQTQIHAENETRVLSVTTDDSRDQTARVLRALADETAPAVDLEEWVTLQRWLATHGERRVTIPYAATLARLIPPVAVRLRRDFGTVLALVRAHAVLHQCSRKRDEAGRVIADLDDYAEVHRVVAEVVAEGVAATVSPTMRETVIAVQVLTQGPEALYPDGAMAQHVAYELRLDRSAARRRLLAASTAGYVTNAEDRRGKPGRWLPGEPLPAAVAVLPPCHQLATELERQTAGQPADTSRGGTVARESEGESG
jgi:hypothetical protein